MQTQGEHAKSTQKDTGPNLGLEPRTLLLTLKANVVPNLSMRLLSVFNVLEIIKLNYLVLCCPK